jgi:plasmid stability protein
MPALVLKNISRNLHRRLKEEAVRHRRSMTQQAIVLLERSLGGSTTSTINLPAPQQLTDPATGLKVSMTKAMLRRAIREGRA